MIAQIGLLGALAALALYALSQRRRTPLVAIAIAAGAVIGAVLVAAPGMATDVALAVGIGRGADLVFYVFILLTLAAVFNLHLRQRAQLETLTQLTRTLALMTARQPTPDERP